jgi:2-polyprenyl-6-methoxyphenol hydroxylase-like FAD-dependent oxidoreductase
MAPLRVLICGAGICGPSLAFWLSRLDCDITVIERGSEIRTTGQQIDFRAQGVGLIKKMGIELAVRARLVKEPGSRIVNENGHTLGYVSPETHEYMAV